MTLLVTMLYWFSPPQIQPYDHCIPPANLFPNFGKSMDTFRADVKALLDEGSTPVFREYAVQKGDSLWIIARRFLGSGERYPEIKTLNGLTDDTIYAGQKLKVPN